MVKIIASNIFSPLGETTDENYHAVMMGKSGLQRHENGCRDVPFPFVASLFDDRQRQRYAVEGLTAFEGMIVHSVREALAHTDVDVTSPRTVFILSTTKGDIGVSPSTTAMHIATELGITSMPIVVCNACISGVAAQILAMRLLENGDYDDAIVAGGDLQGRFIISGFNSLQALSPEPCRPFDAERLGLNLGEGAATIVLSNREAYPDRDSGTDTCDTKDKRQEEWYLLRGAICNDAWHISGPHPKGEGAYRALTRTLKDWSIEEIAVVGVHGTATMYNDQMESKAIERAGLSAIPLSALKGYYGHTMGAAGVIETVLTARALEDGVILPSKGYNERGVSGKVTISNMPLKTDKRTFVKMLSGFGGCNGAVLWSTRYREEADEERMTLRQRHSIRITEQDDLSAIYKEKIGGYPKFYKMDLLSRLAFVATELLLQMEREEGTDVENGESNRAVVLFSSSSSSIADRAFIKTIGEEEYFPSPSVFVYTLPNITTGEIALRNGYHGETAFYILPEKDEHMMMQIINATMQDCGAGSVITGWIDATSETEYSAEVGVWYAERCSQAASN